MVEARFENKTIIVSGATSGIGEAVSKKFALEGANVIMLGRNVEKARKIQDDIGNYGGKSDFYKCDVTLNDEVEEVVEQILSKYMKIDVLFNNAGIMLQSKELERLPIKEWNITFQTNLESIFYLVKYLKKTIIEAKGNIINNASIAGMHSYIAGRSYAYSASKAAVIQLTRQMAKNYASEGVRVNCICPGIIDTPILGDRDRKIYEERIPLGYVGTTEEVADVVAFLASKEAKYITGVVLPIDGGASL